MVAPADAGRSDAELVRRYLDGDQRALGDIYERYADRVHDLCLAMLHWPDDAADAYQDTFLVAARKLEGLRDPDRLRPWLYSVARNQCRARIRARKRTRLDADVGVEVDMTARIARVELAELMADARVGLNDRDQEVLDLHMRHGLEGDELAAVLDVSVDNAYKLVERVRDRVERSLGSFLVARHGREDCPELGELLTDWDGAFSPLMRKRIGRHVDGCEVCSRRRKGLLDPGGLAGAMPLHPAPTSIRAAVLARVLTAAPPLPGHEPGWRDDGFPAALGATSPSQARRRRPRRSRAARSAGDDRRPRRSRRPVRRRRRRRGRVVHRRCRPADPHGSGERSGRGDDTRADHHLDGADDDRIADDRRAHDDGGPDHHQHGAADGHHCSPHHDYRAPTTTTTTTTTTSTTTTTLPPAPAISAFRATTPVVEVSPLRVCRGNSVTSILVFASADTTRVEVTWTFAGQPGPTSLTQNGNGQWAGALPDSPFPSGSVSGPDDDTVALTANAWAAAACPPRRRRTSPSFPADDPRDHAAARGRRRSFENLPRNLSRTVGGCSGPTAATNPVAQHPGATT